jgi:hypothetical protein
MENNWKEKAEELLREQFSVKLEENELFYDETSCIDTILEAMNLVFEATKKECANKAELTDFASEFLQEGCNEAIDRESILNINKPNI